MEKVYFSVVFLVALVLAMETDACDTMEGLGCTSMCDYTLKMLNKMTSIEIEIREAMRCLTEQVLSCSDTSDTGMYVCTHARTHVRVCLCVYVMCLRFFTQ